MSFKMIPNSSEDLLEPAFELHIDNRGVEEEQASPSCPFDLMNISS